MPYYRATSCLRCYTFHTSKFKGLYHYSYLPQLLPCLPRLRQGLFCKHLVPENDLHLDEGGGPLVPDAIPDKAEPWLIVITGIMSVFLVWFVVKHFVA